MTIMFADELDGKDADSNDEEPIFFTIFFTQRMATVFLRLLYRQGTQPAKLRKAEALKRFNVIRYILCKGLF